MLNSILSVSLRYKLLVIMAFIIIAGFGVRAWQAVPLDAFPDVTPAQVNVYTESAGLASEDVEKLITFPVESSLAGLAGIDYIRSVSCLDCRTSASTSKTVPISSVHASW